MEEGDGVSSTQRAAGSDTAEGTEERVIRALPIVTTLSFVHAVKDKERGVRVSLTCYNCREYDSGEKPQEAPTEALTKKAAADAASAATVTPDTTNVLQAMMQLEQAKFAQKPQTRLLCTCRIKRMLLNKKCKGCNSCYKPRELEHILQQTMPMRSVITKHRTTGILLIIATIV